eukprot:TRINITY_DN2968_c0_g1_i15.p2 TRINITY_DN2968_c0_g1~~TRINITY_DN2968_c0_g1_i15.p2  ORF type:complete len:109 (-),score=6.82 TRINITY_DN2968_c0_g1_i15:23-349(-)
MVNVTCWMISNLCKGSPGLPLSLIQPLITPLNTLLLHVNDSNAIVDILLMFFYVTEKAEGAKALFKLINVHSIAFLATTDNLSIKLSLIHICRCRRYAVCRSRWSPYH